jgi:hypothetical protein
VLSCSEPLSNPSHRHPTMTSIRQNDLIESIAAALQYIS